MAARSDLEARCPGRPGTASPRRRVGDAWQTLRGGGHARRLLEVAAFVGVPMALVGELFVVMAQHGGRQFHGAFYGWDIAIFRHAGLDVLQGRSPYVAPTVELLRTEDKFVYPTPFSLPFVPLAVMPERVAMVAFLALSLAALFGALWLFGVRDYRCYGVAVLGVPVLQALADGALGPLLLLLAALGWRYRDRRVAGVPLALAAAAKLFLWPLLVWLVFTRRTRAAVSAAATLAVVFALWLLVDPAGLRRYPATLKVLDEVQRPKSYSLESLLAALGAPRVASTAVLVVLAAVGTAWIGIVARRRGERAAFGAAIVVALATTPILWLHYLVLLVVPLALVQPSLAAVWLVPLALAGIAGDHADGSVWRIAGALVAIAIAGAVSLHTVRGTRSDVSPTRRATRAAAPS